MRPCVRAVCLGVASAQNLASVPQQCISSGLQIQQACGPEVQKQLQSQGINVRGPPAITHCSTSPSLSVKTACPIPYLPASRASEQGLQATRSLRLCPPLRPAGQRQRHRLAHRRVPGCSWVGQSSEHRKQLAAIRGVLPRSVHLHEECECKGRSWHCTTHTALSSRTAHRHEATPKAVLCDGELSALCCVCTQLCGCNQAVVSLIEGALGSGNSGSIASCEWTTGSA